MVRAPVETVADLDTLDSGEMVEGYFDGFKGEPEPGGNRSRSYWHGWRNGATDGKHREIDAAQRRLAHEVVSSGRHARPLRPTREPLAQAHAQHMRRGA